MDDIRKKSFTALKWDLTGKLLNHGVTFVLSIFLARLLTPKDFGIMGVAMVCIALAQSFLSLGLSAALVQNPRTTKLQESTVFYINIALGGALATLFYVSASLISDYYDNPALTSIIQVLSSLFILNSLNVVQSAHIRKKLRFEVFAKADVISSIISGVTGVAMAFTGFGVWSLVAKTMLHASFRTLIIWYHSTWRPGLMFNIRAIGQLWSYGSKLFVSGLINTVYERVDVLIIGKMFSITQLGFFNRAKSFNEIIIMFTSKSLTRVLFPVFSYIQDNTEKVRATVAKSLNALSFLVFGLMGILFLCASDIIVLLFGSQWLPSIPFFQILVFSAYCHPIGSVLVNVLSGLGNSKAFLKLEVIKKILLTLAIPIGFYFGIEGYLIAMVIVGFLNVLINMWFVEKQILYSLKKQFKDVFMYVIPALMAGIISYYTVLSLSNMHAVHLLSATGLYGVLYIGLNYLSRTQGFNTMYGLCLSGFRRVGLVSP